MSICKSSSTCPVCAHKFRSGSYHPADKKLYDHTKSEGDEAHILTFGGINWGDKKDWFPALDISNKNGSRLLHHWCPLCNEEFKGGTDQ